MTDTCKAVVLATTPRRSPARWSALVDAGERGHRSPDCEHHQRRAGEPRRLLALPPKAELAGLPLKRSRT